MPGLSEVSGAGNETRTRDPNLGKVVLYQLSYSRDRPAILVSDRFLSSLWQRLLGKATSNRASAPRQGIAAPCPRATSEIHLNHDDRAKARSQSSVRRFLS